VDSSATVIIFHFRVGFSRRFAPLGRQHLKGRIYDEDPASMAGKTSGDFHDTGDRDTTGAGAEAELQGR
jgi:hypothetical protein